MSRNMDSDIHVLAVDDSLLDRKVVERLLKNSSYKVTTVDSAERALEVLGIVEAAPSVVLNAFNINLIITDYCMPEMTGYDLLKRVKESSALKQIPVVIMSSENVPSRISRCLAEGAEEFIIKPLQVADVKRLRGFIYQPQEPDSIYMKRRAAFQASICAKRQAISERHSSQDSIMPETKQSKEGTADRMASEATKQSKQEDPDSLVRSKESPAQVLFRQKTGTTDLCSPSCCPPSCQCVDKLLARESSSSGFFFRPGPCTDDVVDDGKGKTTQVVEFGSGSSSGIPGADNKLDVLTISEQLGDEICIK